MFLPFEQDINSNKILIHSKLFTKEECEVIVDFLNKKNKHDGLIGGLKGELNHNVRKNKIVWVDGKDKSFAWVINKIANYVKEINEKEYKFDIYGLTEDIQFTEYTELNDQYTWHSDSNVDSQIRKLSFVIQLSDPKDYEGCQLEFANHTLSKLNEDNKINDFEKMKLAQGSIISFPSYVLHRVTPLIKGKRNSLVLWVGGPNFK